MARSKTVADKPETVETSPLQAAVEAALRDAIPNYDTLSPQELSKALKQATSGLKRQASGQARKERKRELLAQLEDRLFTAVYDYIGDANHRLGERSMVKGLSVMVRPGEDGRPEVKRVKVTLGKTHPDRLINAPLAPETLEQRIERLQKELGAAYEEYQHESVPAVNSTELDNILLNSA